MKRILRPTTPAEAPWTTPTTDVIQGTLDMLILKTLSLEPMHGFGIARRVEQISRGVFKVNPGSLLTALQRLERAGLLDAEWRQTENSRRAQVLLAHARRPETARDSRRRTGPAARRDRAPAEGGGVSDVPLASAGARSARADAPDARADHDLADEVRHFLEQATAAHLARGLSPDEARRAARLELGNTTVVREQVRAYGWENVVETLLADLRYAARRLRRNPGFTAVSVLTLALGIGASTAIFSAVNPILFEPLPYPDAERIVMISDVGAATARASTSRSARYRELAERSRSFEALAVMRPWQPTITGAAEPERLDGQRVSADYFRVLGVLAGASVATSRRRTTGSTDRAS